MAFGEEASVETFDTFISYNHHDEAMASAIERAIERFATPFYKRRRISVFRDSTSMTVDPDLWQAITHPMDNARFVLLLASTHSATSKWVNREIGYCIEKKGIDQLLPVVLEGTWQWDAQLGRYPTDPVAAWSAGSAAGVHDRAVVRRSSRRDGIAEGTPQGPTVHQRGCQTRVRGYATFRWTS